VGHALTRAFSVLPVSVKLVETRPDYLCDLPEGVEPVALAAPEAAIQSAPSGLSHWSGWTRRQTT